MAEEVNGASRRRPWRGIAAEEWVNIARILDGTHSNCENFQPWMVLPIGIIYIAIWYFVGSILFLAISKISIVSFWQLWQVFIAWCIAVNSIIWVDIALALSSMMNFPHTWGICCEILKAYVGFSAAVYIQLDSGVLQKSSANLLLCLTVGLPIICLATMYPVRVCPQQSEQESACPIVGQVGNATIGLYLLLPTLLGDALSQNNATYIMFGVTILFLLLRITTPLVMTLYGSSHQTNSTTDSSERTYPRCSENSESRTGEIFVFKQAKSKFKFWLLFFVFLAGVGSGVTVLDYFAAGVNDTTVLLCLFSFFSFAGRLGGRYFSDNFFRSRLIITRSVWMTFTQIIMIVTCILFSFGDKIMLYVSIVLLGMCYGVQFSVMMQIVSDRLGELNGLGIYNFMLLGNPLGALCFSVFLDGSVSVTEATKQQQEYGLPSSTSCLGLECFGLTFKVLAGVYFVGTILSIIVTSIVKTKSQAIRAGLRTVPP